MAYGINVAGLVENYCVLSLTCNVVGVKLVTIAVQQSGTLATFSGNMIDDLATGVVCGLLVVLFFPG